ncbi:MULTISPECIES: (4Fe-4S)-binding protein [unclassified Streptomyces]|uniref:(4Fe-4S)-binding protein n=1 Tax=unclassified Streptomyces TaxID=2593676 RepID=UPI001BE59843|nr:MULTISPECIES: (4Fe-4S)-binding protein [unclassified Streptomyces]MBT2407372.1 (4Fe-4S)-binding protein [Streptomyces sp. ISL-21]MBT2455437.1 (4Fe-4S)-binding protein [Streptomyces sp. ISL-86]MBT2611051.1 (4Fe-4S)-binding protein [Streptomyces sp. ISL-87]
MPSKEPKAYDGKRITVTYDTGRCLHAAECVRGLPEVFDTGQRPWVQPDGADPERVAEVIRRCPSGALQYRLADGPAEQGDRPTTVVRSPVGQLILRGELSVTTPQGVRSETRAMLCACGVSRNQPYCDHSGACGSE